MRKLIYFTGASLDGYIARLDRSIDWALMDAELHSYINAMEAQFGGWLFGRRTYELMQEYWPSLDMQTSEPVEIEFAHIYERMPKTVFSSTLERVEGNARLVRGDPVPEVRRLKALDGADLECGGAELAGALMRAGLVDEYRILWQPLLLGEGIPMFPVHAQSTSLRLLETKTFSNGVVYVRYERA